MAEETGTAAGPIDERSAALARLASARREYDVPGARASETEAA
jgi:hypothetical protein